VGAGQEGADVVPDWAGKAAQVAAGLSRTGDGSGGDR
jgi:hypothetical protein